VLRGRVLWLAIAIAVPALIVFWTNASFVYNHFHEAPYLHDSGWYSFIIWRQGFFPRNPPVAHPLPAYYGIHVSLLVSIASLLSYAFPWDRVDWYCLFQGAIYTPLAIAPALLCRRPGGLRAAAIVAIAALFFAYNGQVLACTGYPHYEILVSGGICVMLAGLATGRTKIAWAGLAIAAATREDGGLHAGLFLGAVFVCGMLMRKPFPVDRRLVILMGVAAFAATGLSMFIQKTFFETANLFRHEYLGEPAYAHITTGELVRRAFAFSERARFVLWPFLATVAVAVLRRDPRYLLGWVAEVPWFFLNLLAAQPLKSQFDIYTGFPFVGSIFWTAAYACLVERERDARRSLAITFLPVTVVSVIATCGLYSSYPAATAAITTFSLYPRSTNRQAMIAFSTIFRKDANAYGRLWRDAAMASWTAESAPFGSWLVAMPDGDAASRCRDGMLFFQPPSPEVGALLASCGYQRCGHLPGTHAYYCGGAERPLPPGLVETSPLSGALFPAEPVVVRVGEHWRVPSSGEPHLALFGPFVKLLPGRYRASFKVDLGSCSATTAALPGFDVWTGTLKAKATLDPPNASIEMPFEVTPDDPPRFEFRVFSGSCDFTVERLEVDMGAVP
jgi:hypothetical protein